jgi:hypothetical protein
MLDIESRRNERDIVHLCYEEEEEEEKKNFSILLKKKWHM